MYKSLFQPFSERKKGNIRSSRELILFFLFKKITMKKGSIEAKPYKMRGEDRTFEEYYNFHFLLTTKKIV